MAQKVAFFAPQSSHILPLRFLKLSFVTAPCASPQPTHQRILPSIALPTLANSDPAAENASLFFQRFRMFVPSLSW